MYLSWTIGNKQSCIMSSDVNNISAEKTTVIKYFNF